MSCWWSEYRDAWFQLTTLGTAADWNPPKHHKHRIYTDGTHSFREKDIAGNFDEVEEQLWAYRNGLTDIVFTIEVVTRTVTTQRRKSTGGGS